MMSGAAILLSLAALSGLAHIFADRAKRHTAIFVFKPLTLLLIIASVAARFDGSALALWILAGLACSLVGDIFLMLRRRRFTEGLGAFLAAHLCYIAAFWSASGKTPLAVWGAGCLWVLTVLLLLGASPGRMRIPVAVYVAALTVMTVQSWTFWSSTSSLRGEFAFAGALLFVISDTVLGFREFRKRFLRGQIIILVTYYAAQIFISLSVPFSP